ncbi:ribonuclease R family protein [Gloeothece verrucosa]|uniref:VacB and RNase II family 3'-5' exoribonuclease n=1 Tax=Gloeothece verrucosa (strain PCC 7822) TaxID=497965 RepID=E0UHK6_GLOV7|nr:ribonuclease R family protein [Gloeothece verrucosa]ADN12147.1 VacB and RNase II family 3'-5' exoribonuclease [Gloeothece verrucosa PCC 7822]
MEFSIATLLSYFSHDKLVAAKVLEKKLGCEDEVSIYKLQIVLEALERIGVLVKERGKYRRVYEENIVEAKLRCSSKGFCFAIQDIEDADDIYVRESHLSNAWNGDRVLVKIIKEGTRRRSPEGEVKLILERANPSLLAQVKRNNGGYRAVPLDDRLLFELDLTHNEQQLENAVDHLVHVSVLRYPIGEHPPLGQVTRILGSDAEAAADTDIVCCKHDLLHAFSESVLKAAQGLPRSFNKSELQKRQDLRKLLTFTVEDGVQRDHPTFIEQAFTLEKPKPGWWQLGIHIADVAHYIEQDSILDKAAKKRGTSIFLREKILPLLPEAVTERCSLIAGEDRLSISIFITLDQTGNVIEFETLPSVIEVDYQFTYTEVQSLLSKSEQVEAHLVSIVEKLKEIFFTLCPLVKAQRLQRGSFEIQLEKQSPFKDEGRGGTVLVSSNLPVQSLISELAILAGKIVAEHLRALGVPAIYCMQPDPDWEELEDLLKLANNLGLDVALSSEEEVTPHDYQNLTQAFSRSHAVKVLSYMLYSTLKQVKYTSHPSPHFGLAYSDCYTHCIAPGQRYVDLLIQRVLKAVFAEGRDRPSKNAKITVNLGSNSCHGQIKWNVLPPQLKDALEEDFHLIVSHLNDRDKVAEDAEKDLEGLKKAEKMKERTGQIFRGLITGVQSYGFFVEIEDLLVEGLVHVSSLKDDWYEYRARHSCLVGRKNRIAYRLGDEVEVEVKNVDYYRQQIDLVTVGGGSALRSEDLDDD